MNAGNDRDAGRQAELGPRFDLTSLGEALVRLSVGYGTRLSDARTLDVHVAGAESNVCAALAGLGRSTGFVTGLPRNPLGDLVMHRLRGWGVDASGVVRSDEGRVGTYFVELTPPPLPIQVVYDRAGSVFAGLEPERLPWERILRTRTLHLTGITPALGAASRRVVEEAVDRAAERGVPISFDVNHRARLWSNEEAARVLRPLLPRVDLLFCKKQDAGLLFGLSGEDETVLDRLCELAPSAQVVMSVGAGGALARGGGRTLRQAAPPVTVVDRIGAGDAFAAGVLDGVLDGDLEGGLATGAGLAALALAQHGDVVTASREEARALARGGGADVLR